MWLDPCCQAKQHSSWGTSSSTDLRGKGQRFRWSQDSGLCLLHPLQPHTLDSLASRGLRQLLGLWVSLWVNRMERIYNCSRNSASQIFVYWNCKKFSSEPLTHTHTHTLQPVLSNYVQNWPLLLTTTSYYFGPGHHYLSPELSQLPTALPFSPGSVISQSSSENEGTKRLNHIVLLLGSKPSHSTQQRKQLSPPRGCQGPLYLALCDLCAHFLFFPLPQPHWPPRSSVMAEHSSFLCWEHFSPSYCLLLKSIRVSTAFFSECKKRVRVPSMQHCLHPTLAWLQESVGSSTHSLQLHQKWVGHTISLCLNALFCSIDICVYPFTNTILSCLL